MAVRHGDESDESGKPLEDDESLLARLESVYRDRIDCIKGALTFRGPDQSVFSNSRFDQQEDNDDDADDDEDYLENIERGFGNGLPHDAPWLEEDDDEEVLLRVEKRKLRDRLVPTGSPETHSSTPDIHETGNGHPSPEDVTGTNAAESGEVPHCSPSSEAGSEERPRAFLPGRYEDPDDDVECATGSPIPDFYQMEESCSPGSEKFLNVAMERNHRLQQECQNLLEHLGKFEQKNQGCQKHVRGLVNYEKYCRRQFACTSGETPDRSLRRIFTRNLRSKDIDTGDKVCEQGRSPPENADVKSYQRLKAAQDSFRRKRWTNSEREELANGIRQQVQVELLGGDAMMAALDRDHLDAELLRVSDATVTAQQMRDILPKIDWFEVQQLYVPGHTVEECYNRWVNFEDPLINKKEWTRDELKRLLVIAQELNLRNWEEIASRLGTQRTPASCLIRYQRSLNVTIMRGNWTPDEDVQLSAAVMKCGVTNWDSVASHLVGRSSNQCLMRYLKVLDPARPKKGRWSMEEDMRLIAAELVYGEKKYISKAIHIPGRTDIQCRERWVNILNPLVKLGDWSPEEIKSLEVAVATHGPHKWSDIAREIEKTTGTVRTDSQCCRCWKKLHPNDQRDYNKAIKMRKIALVQNFQGRKQERSTLCLEDFVAKGTDAELGLDDGKPKPKKKPGPKRKGKKAEELPVPHMETAGERRAERLKKRKLAKATKVVGDAAQVLASVSVEQGEERSLSNVGEKLNAGRKRKAGAIPRTSKLSSSNVGKSSSKDLQTIHPEVTSFVDMVASAVAYCEYSHEVALEESWPPSFQSSRHGHEVAGEGDTQNSGFESSPEEESGGQLLGKLGVGHATAGVSHRGDLERRADLKRGTQPDSCQAQLMSSPGKGFETSGISSEERGADCANGGAVSGNCRAKHSVDLIGPQIAGSAGLLFSSPDLQNRDGWSAEDEEVALASRAVLSWPFFRGLQEQFSLDTADSNQGLSKQLPRATCRKK